MFATVPHWFGLMSPSLRGSGLKYRLRQQRLSQFLVSLFTREWIEILSSLLSSSMKICLPLYEGVDWNKRSWEIAASTPRVSLFTREWIEIPIFRYWGITESGLPLYEGVDWNVWNIEIDNGSSASPSLRGSGLKYMSEPNQFLDCHVSLFTREWIEIAFWYHLLEYYWVSLFTREWIEIWWLS